MLNIEQQTIDKLFRDLTRIYSTSATSLIGLVSIKTAIEELTCDDVNLYGEIMKLSDAIKNTQPRMFPLDNLMLILDNQIKSLSNKKQLTKESVNKILNTFRIRLESDLSLLVEEGIKWIENGDFIVIHSIEENIEHLIPEAKKRGINFKILVLKQDIVTTGKILNILNEHQIEFEVIPEYDLVHYFDKITKLFIGTQSLTNDNYIICDPGTSNIVSECHIHKIPIMLLLKSLKFSNYLVSDQNIRKNNFQDEHAGVKYSFSIHSNDIIKLNLISHIITEKGEVTNNKIDIFRKKLSSEY
jgi:translation initiation factor 2B subunit (eIF-2B alpha/beta/delta family)